MDTLNYILKKFGLPLNSPQGQVFQLPDFTRNDLPTLLSELNFKIGAEIGVESGDYSFTLLNRRECLDKLYSIDAWKAHRAYRDHTNQNKLDQFYKNTVEKLSVFGNRSTIIRKFSMDAVKEFEDRSLDFVYIDANHKFVEFTNDLHHWSKKVRVGGIVAGHDYTRYKNPEIELHIPYVLDGYLKAYQISPLFIIGENVDSVKSWFYIQLKK